MRNVFTLEQTLNLTHFKLALGVAGILAIGFALVANGGQAVRVDGQAEQLVFVFTQAAGSLRLSMSSSVSG